MPLEENKERKRIVLKNVGKVLSILGSGLLIIGWWLSWHFKVGSAILLGLAGILLISHGLFSILVSIRKVIERSRDDKKEKHRIIIRYIGFILSMCGFLLFVFGAGSYYIKNTHVFISWDTPYPSYGDIGGPIAIIGLSILFHGLMTLVLTKPDQYSL